MSSKLFEVLEKAETRISERLTRLQWVLDGLCATTGHATYDESELFTENHCVYFFDGDAMDKEAKVVFYVDRSDNVKAEDAVYVVVETNDNAHTFSHICAVKKLAEAVDKLPRAFSD